MQTDSIIFQIEMCMKTRKSNIARLILSLFTLQVRRKDKISKQACDANERDFNSRLLFDTVKTAKVKFLVERDVKCTYLAISGQVSSKVTAEVNCIVILLVVLDRPELFAS